MPINLSTKKKIIAISIAVILIMSIFTLWFAYMRAWSIEELYSKLIEPNGIQSFPADFANTSVTVTGIPAGKEVWKTNRGLMTVLGFNVTDNRSKYIALSVWSDGSSYAVGERAYLQVTFEWSIFNGEPCVLSPQIAYPGVGYLLPIEVVVSAVNHVQGVYYDVSETAEDRVKIDLLDVSRPCNLSSSNCSLMSYVHGGVPATYIGSMGMPDTRLGLIETDRIDNLSLKEGKEGFIGYNDSNGNELMDAGDSIIVGGLQKPIMQSGAQCYMLVLNSSFGPNESDHRHILCFIVMYSQGLTRIIGGDYPNFYPYCRFEDQSSSTAIKVQVAYTAGGAQWDELSISLKDSHFNAVSDWDLSDVEFSIPSPSFAYLSSHTSILDVNCTIVDLEGNGLVDKGDYVLLTPVNGTSFVSQDSPYVLRISNNAGTSQLCNLNYYAQ